MSKRICNSALVVDIPRHTCSLALQLQVYIVIALSSQMQRQQDETAVMGEYGTQNNLLTVSDSASVYLKYCPKIDELTQLTLPFVLKANI